ncbi:pentatricopeptide repeat-containing protein At3g48250, chloroplastic-like [Coffea arabica]|uniref:Pentatricopeptide repeat-containing protein At3g48250, chloroplastic-like n=1 Tax=Coffea arabica TaxID=13443 RepID=A0A6P6X3P4_COFAR|nr:pentatricopeptide repeat-containing protein At3g48250, chloroplastic-like [Coffea arabica]
MKHQAKRLLSCLRVANSLHSTHLLRTRSRHTQVTGFPHHSSPFFPTKIFYPVSSLHESHHRKLFFSTKSEPIFDELLSKDWAKGLEKELSSLNPRLTHETVLYILMKLGKEPEKASSFFKWAIEEKGFRPSTSIYSLMLRIYAKNHAMKEFWVVIKEMKEKGYYIDEETYASIYSDFRNSKLINDATALKHFYERMIQENAMETVVQRVVEVVKNSDWSSELERELEDMRFSVSENFVLRVLKELRGKGLPWKALSFFKWVGESLGYEHTSVTYNGMLRILCKGEVVTEFWSMVKEMKDAGYEIDIDTYVKVMREFQKSMMVKDAVELYEHMMDSPFKPLEKECSLLLRAIAYAQDPDLDLMLRVVKKYEDAGYCLLKNDYDGIHRCLTSVGKFDEAEKILETMRNAGYEPDNITYSQLIFGLCKAKRLEEACEVLDVMEAQGCTPDIKTWTILIKGYCVVNEVDKALLWLGKMVEKGIDADADLLDVLVYGFLIEKRVVGAYQLVVEMIDKAHVRPWQATFKDLIEKLLGERRLEEALNLLHLMKKQNYPPYPEPIIQYVSKFGSVDDAWGCLMAISNKQYPSVSAYQRVFQSFFNEGRHSEAKDLLFKCPHHIRKHSAISSLFGSSESNLEAVST